MDRPEGALSLTALYDHITEVKKAYTIADVYLVDTQGEVETWQTEGDIEGQRLKLFRRLGRIEIDTRLLDLRLWGLLPKVKGPMAGYAFAKQRLAYQYVRSIRDADLATQVTQVYAQVNKALGDAIREPIDAELTRDYLELTLGRSGVEALERFVRKEIDRALGSNARQPA